MRIPAAVLLCLTVLGMFFTANAAPMPPRPSLPLHARLPLAFEPNVGQGPDGVDFVARGPGYALSLHPDGMTLSLPPRPALNEPIGDSIQSESLRTAALLRLGLAGANERPTITPTHRLPGVVNHFRGSDPRHWHTQIPTYGEVKYADVYPGIDLVFHGDEEQLEYDFVMRPGADSSVINLDVMGATDAWLDAAGNLCLETPAGQVQQRSPILYQTDADGRHVVSGRFTLRRLDGPAADSFRVGFEVGAFDRTRPLVIDPVLVFGTYLGGSNAENTGIGSASTHFAMRYTGLAVLPQGDVWITGTTSSPDFPTTNAIHASFLGAPLDGVGQPASFGDVFLARFHYDKRDPANPKATLVTSTYLGGSGTEYASGAGVDAAGNVYIAGFTGSDDFPRSPGFGLVAYETNAPGASGFIMSLNPTGSGIRYSSTLRYVARLNGLAVTPDGQAAVTGYTESRPNNFFPLRALPLVNAFQGTNGGASGDAFVMRFAPSGGLVFSTYLGGDGGDEGHAVAFGPQGDLYVTGSTLTRSFPLFRAFQTTPASAFLTRFNNSGQLVYSTYFGGTGFNNANLAGLTVDSSGSAVLVGYTTALDFPVLNAIQPKIASNNDSDAFIAKFTPDGSQLVFSTYLGTFGRPDFASGVALDGAGNIYVTGAKGVSDFVSVPTTRLGFDPGFDGRGYDAFLIKLKYDGSKVIFANAFGGDREDYGRGIGLDFDGNIHIAGVTYSTNFPALHGYLTKLNRGATGSGGQGSRQSDAFLTCISQDTSCIDLHGLTDTDGDGLLDCWELSGIDVDNDGIVDLDLPALGADPLRKDVFVEVDYMTNGAVSIRPLDAAIEQVRQAFLSATVVNPDGSTGINLHVQVDGPGAFIPVLRFSAVGPGADTYRYFKDGPAGGDGRAGNFGSDNDRASANWPRIRDARRKVFRYCVFGNLYAEFPGSSGSAELPGDDFIVTLGAFDAFNTLVNRGGECRPGENALECGRRELEAGTFMHELGHTLGLRHGGGDDLHAKPNYLSIMSYVYQFKAAVPDRVLDYSRKALDSVNESRLNERIGLSGPAARPFVYGGSGRVLSRYGRFNQAIDLDRDGTLTETARNDINHVLVPLDVNQDGIPEDFQEVAPADGLSFLDGFEDWHHLVYNFRETLAYGYGAPVDPNIHEPTPEELAAMAKFLDLDGDGIPNATDNCPDVFNPDQKDADLNGIGDVCERFPGAANLGIGMSVPPVDLVEGALFRWTLVVTNAGPDPARNARMVAMPPEGLSIEDFDGVPGAMFAQGRIHVGLGTLAPGASATLEVRLRPMFSGTHTLAATVGSGLMDPNSDDNVAELAVEVREGLTLRARLVGATLEISWPASESTALLESSSTIQPTVWVVVGAAVEVVQNRRVVRIAAPDAASFYRLRVQ